MLGQPVKIHLLMLVTKNLLNALLITLLASQAALAEPSLPRTSDGKPDFNGIWQTLDSHSNIEAHTAHASSILQTGALGATRAGLGAVIGGEIPYKPAARLQQQTNFATRHELDPAVKCYLPGVPRANLMPYPVQIVQIPDHLFLAHEFAQASRTIYLDKPDFEAPVDAWMGHSRGHWEGDTLVVNVTDQVPDTWLDAAGNWHTASLKVEERYTLLSAHHLRYRATLSDPEVYESTWSLEAILYKNVDPKAQLLDFKCIEFVETLMYGHLSKRDTGLDTSLDTSFDTGQEIQNED
ncbi:MAG: hypothetical protein ACI9ON_003630 [Limisphaerales bacterium]|jgi:hypothetical protein